MPQKNTICLWYDGTALEAAQFYAKTFPNSAVGAMHCAPADYPAGKQGDALVVEFTVAGIACIGINGGPGVPHGMAFSFHRPRGGQARVRGHDGDGQHQYCGHRGGGTRIAA